MQRIFVRELKPYSLDGLASVFGMDVARAKQVVKEFMARGIVRYRPGSASDDADLSDEEEAAPDELFQFAFVGLAMVGDLVAVAYPKYFRDREPSDEELRQILRVVKRDAGRASIASLSEEGERTDDKLPVMLALLELYAEYGVYSNYIDGIELNGVGVIDWNRTIGNHLPVISDGRPIYVEYESRKTLRDDSDFITRLHRAVLTECSKQLHDAGIDELLSLDEVWLSDEEVEDLGDSETLTWRLERERGSQFADWKILVLELLKRYLFDRESTAERDEVRAIGTMSFYNLWEKACKIAFGDSLDTKLGNLGIPLADGWVERKRDTLLGIIEHPKWQRYFGGEYEREQETDTLIPDTIAFSADGAGAKTFCIYDAKYYVPSASGKMKCQPGLESVTKQFLYQSAYKQFVLDHGFKRVVNVFLVPTAGDKLVRMARVEFSKVMGEVEPPFNKYVHMWALPAHEIFDAYLQGKRIDGGAMRAIWEEEE